MVKITILPTDQRSSEWRTLWFCLPQSNWINPVFLKLQVLDNEKLYIKFVKLQFFCVFRTTG